MENLVALVSLCLVLLGLAGAFVPRLPDAPLIFLGAWLYAHFTGYRAVGRELVLGLFLLALVAVGLDWAASRLGWGWFRMTPAGLVGTVAGGIVGLALAGPAGLLPGPLLGGLAGEVAAGRSLRGALQALVAAWLGFFGRVVLKGLIIVTMAAVFLFRAF